MSSEVRVPRLLRSREVEKLTGIPRWRLYELIAQGKAPPHLRVGKTIRFPEDALVRWIEEQSKQGGRKAQRWSQQRVAGDEWQDLGFVFTRSKGTPLHGARRSFERVSAKAGLGEWGPEPKREHQSGPLPAREFTPAFRIYDLRHTFVSLLLMHGVPVNVVADLAGHEKGSFTIARYGHALPKQQREATEKLQSLLFKTA